MALNDTIRKNLKKTYNKRRNVAQIAGKTIIAVFAHPDDEAFGPSGTLYKLSRYNRVILVCVTNGANGEKTTEMKNLAKTRTAELRRSAAILGIQDVILLNFEDGGLSNNVYGELREAIGNVMDKYRPELAITYEQRGVSGHLDHVAVSMAVSHLLYRKNYLKTIWYYALSPSQRGAKQDYFVYKPPGYSEREVDLVVNVADVWDIKKEAIHQHESQASDVASLTKRLEKAPRKELFFEVGRVVR